MQMMDSGLRRTSSSLLPLLVPLVFKLLFAAAGAAGVQALPTSNNLFGSAVYLRKYDDLDDGSEIGPDQWVYLTTAVALVLLGGAFSGLTIALMGQDEIYLQVIATSGEVFERENAQRVLDLLKRGKHWVLVTVLLGNVITNETLPIMLDRSLGGGIQAVVGSTILIVIFGEIVPQSVCVRYGLPIGAFMAPFVWMLMLLLAPVAWPTAKLLDYLLGVDHGTTYKKAGLKTLVTLHRTLGTGPGERLSKDEVTIISAVLDLKEKPIGGIMTPMEDVFTLSADTILDETMMHTILSEGYSRIPIYAVDDPNNFIGMLLVKMLITYDPEDCFRVGDFQLATLPETRPETSCLDIINFFQEGKSHMVLISEFPGDSQGALGVVTLEDVIEELIGEEIIDESDVYIDVHKAIRRIHPTPWFRIPKAALDLDGEVNEHNYTALMDATLALTRTGTHSSDKGPGTHHTAAADHTIRSPTLTAVLMRRRSVGGAEPVLVDRKPPELRAHLKHLGPSNAAAAPKQTKINSVKIKPGKNQGAKPSEAKQPSEQHQGQPEIAVAKAVPSQIPGDLNKNRGEETVGLLSAGHAASDGVHALGYGTLSSSPTTKTKEIGHRAKIGSLPDVMEWSENWDGQQETSSKSNHEGGGGGGGEGDGEGNGNGKNNEEAILPSLVEPRVSPKPTQQSSSTLVDTTGPTTSSHSDSQSPNQPTFESRGASLSIPAKLVISSEHPESVVSDHDEEEELARPEENSSGSTAKASMRSTGTDTAVRQAAAAAAAARSGSILERDVDVGGVKKVVLETMDGHPYDDAELLPAKPEKKKRRKKRGGKKSKKAGEASSQGLGLDPGPSAS